MSIGEYSWTLLQAMTSEDYMGEMSWTDVRNFVEQQSKRMDEAKAARKQKAPDIVTPLINYRKFEREALEELQKDLSGVDMDKFPLETLWLRIPDVKDFLEEEAKCVWDRLLRNGEVKWRVCPKASLHLSFGDNVPCDVPDCWYLSEPSRMNEFENLFVCSQTGLRCCDVCVENAGSDHLLEDRLDKWKWNPDQDLVRALLHEIAEYDPDDWDSDEE